MSFEVKKAKRQRRPLKINLEGVSGSGKTFTALRMAFAMRRAGIGTRIVVADSENESAGLYDGVTIDGETWSFDVCPIPQEKQNPAGYTEVYEFLTDQGFDIVIGDSLTHAWYGAQELVDRYAAANRNDKFGGWAKVTPQQRQMLATLTDGRAHLVATMRVKSEYERVPDERTGKEKIKKVGTKTDQREGAEYEFDVVARLDHGAVPTDHVITIEKVRGCTAMDGRAGVNPGPDFWKPLFDWWLSAQPVVAPEEDGRRRLDAADTLDNLAATWNALPKHVQAKLVADKDRRKAELSRTSAAPLTGGAADDAGDPAALDRLRTDLDAELADRGTTLEAVLRDHARALGIDPARRLPRMDELTAGQLDWLLDAFAAAPPPDLSAQSR